MIRPSHHGQADRQQAWIVFGGGADMAWQRLLRPGFRHCFAALRDEAGWLVLDPLSGCLLVARIDVPADFDLPGFYRRAGLLPVGPLAVGTPRATALPALLPMNCVGLCRAVLGHAAPFAMTPNGLYRRLITQPKKRKKSLTMRIGCVYTSFINGRIASVSQTTSRPAPLTRALAFFSSLILRRETPMGSLFKAPKPVRVDPPAPAPQPVLPTPAAVTETVSVDTRNRALRGLQGTIATSPLGVLAAAPAGLTRKSLLGE